jgi:hypothetical protein
VTAEEKAIAALRANPGDLPEELIDFIPELFEKLREIEERVAKLLPGQMYEPMWGLLGLTTRTYQLMICFIEQIAGRNFNGFWAGFRALVETLCAAIWVSRKPDRLPSSLVQQTPLSIGKIMNAGYQKFPDLMAVYAAVEESPAMF